MSFKSTPTKHYSWIHAQRRNHQSVSRFAARPHAHQGSIWHDIRCYYSEEQSRTDSARRNLFVMSLDLIRYLHHCTARHKSTSYCARSPLRTPANATDARRIGLRLAIRAQCNAERHLMNSLSTDLSTTGNKSESLLGSRICAGTSSRVIASLCWKLAVLRHGCTGNRIIPA